MSDEAPVDWKAVVSMIDTIPELHAFWTDNSAALTPEDRERLTRALDVRKAEIQERDAKSPAEPPRLVVTEQKLLALDEEREAVVDAYRNALDEEAQAEAEYRRVRATTWLRFRDELDKETGKRATNGETDMRTDADDTVAAARQRAYLAAGVAKGIRANLDRIEQSFQLHRSLLVRDRPNV